MKVLQLMLSSLMLCLALTACGGGGSDDSSSGGTNACGQVGLGTRVINGQTCSGLASSSIVRVAAVLTDGTDTLPFPICTGTMITLNDVLTATHCFINSELFGFPVIGYGILTGDAGSIRFFNATEVLAAPNFSVGNGRLFNDAAVMQLSSSPGLPPLPLLLRRAAQVGEQAFVYGYGREAQGEPASLEEIVDDSLTLVAGSMTIQNITNDHIFVGFDGAGTNVCNGDSGGPMILVVDSVPTIIGVVSQGSVPGCRPGDITTFTNMQNSQILSWLSDIVPDTAAF